MRGLQGGKVSSSHVSTIFAVIVSRHRGSIVGVAGHTSSVSRSRVHLEHVGGGASHDLVTCLIYAACQLQLASQTALTMQS